MIISNSRETDNNEIVLAPPSYNISSNITKRNEIEESSEDDEIEDDENTPLLKDSDNNNNNNNETNQYLSNHVNINNYFESDPSTPMTSTPTPSIRNNTKPFKEQLINTLFPYLKDWHHQSFMTKCINIFSLPFNLVLTLTIPVITPEIQNAYKQQVKKAKENSENTMHQRRRHLHHRRHHRHHSHKQVESDDIQNEFISHNDREYERIEKMKKQQLSRIVTESKLKHSSLSRSTSFEEIDSLVREGMMKKQQQLIRQSKLSKSFTHDNLFMEDHPEPTSHPLKKSQSLNQILIKKKYKSNSVHDPEGRKALLNTSLMNSQKQKGNYGLSHSFSANRISPLTNLSPISPPKFENNSEEATPTSGGVVFKELNPSEYSNNSSPTRDSLSEYNPNNSPRNIQMNTIYPSTSLPSEHSVVMMNGIDPYPLASNVNSGHASTSTSPVKSNLINRVMSVSSINNYNFNDINEYNSYFMETNNISMSPNGSYYDLNSIYDNNNLSHTNSYVEFPCTEPLLNHDTNLNSNVKGSAKENSNGNTTTGEIVLSEVWNKWLIVISTTICPLFIMTVLSICK